MNDYINRQCEYWDSESNHCALYRPSAQPIDAVEVVQCKDCIYYQLFNNECNGICNLHIDAFRVFYPNDYCSYGERK